jgi:hypothetical protein
LVGSLGLAAGAGNWAERVPPPPSPARSKELGYSVLDYRTSFYEEHVRRFGPSRQQTAVGVPGFAPIIFGDEMRTRYSEFELVFPGGWLPGAVNEWPDDGISGHLYLSAS